MDLYSPVDAGTEDPVIGLCMLLSRLAYPNRLADQAIKFGWRVEKTPEITNVLLDFLTRQWKFLLDFDETRLTPEKLEAYALSIHMKNNCPLKTCWGFVEGDNLRHSKTCTKAKNLL